MSNNNTNVNNIFQVIEDKRKIILAERASDIVGTVRAKDGGLWWEEPHSILNDRTPLEVLTVAPLSESAVLLMKAAIYTAKSASKIIIF